MHFFETEITNQLFGNGFNFSYIVNDIRSGVTIWAHSDFVSILLSLGFCGLLVYIYILLKVFISSAYLSKKLQFSLISYMLFPAFFNGFYMYQCYVFSFVLIYVFLNTISPAGPAIKKSF